VPYYDENTPYGGFNTPGGNNEEESKSICNEFDDKYVKKKTNILDYVKELKNTDLDD